PPVAPVADHHGDGAGRGDEPAGPLPEGGRLAGGAQICRGAGPAARGGEPADAEPAGVGDGDVSAAPREFDGDPRPPAIELSGGSALSYSPKGCRRALRRSRSTDPGS